jgi:hypothetical protein
MSQLLVIGLLAVILLAALVVRLRGPKRRERWMPDIRRVV